MSQKKPPLSRGLYRRTLAGLMLLGCGGALGGPITGGESHFLSRCDGSCGGGLDCVSEVCTRGCLVKDASCTDLAKNALCTADSIEPGAVAVCDVSCDNDVACRELGAEHRCDNGFCRAPVVSSGGSGGAATGGASGVSGGSGAATGGASGASGGAGGSSGQGKSCTVFKIEYSSGTQDIPAPSGCGTCDCNDGSLACTDPACPDGRTVVECPENVSTDPIRVDGYELAGRTLTLEVSHAGGCVNHDYRLCYGPEFLTSYPVQSGLRLIHDAHGDTCEANLTASLKFDLSALGAAYTRAFRQPGGLISTPYGLYGFGDAECDERTRAAGEQARAAAERAAGPCDTAVDCEVAYFATSCSPGCGTPLATANAEHLRSVLSQVETDVCNNFEAKGCAIAVPPCLPPQPLDCVQGRCVETTP